MARNADIKTRALSASEEDYLEAILFAIREHRVGRVRDIASSLGVGAPAVTAALKSLSSKGLVNYDPYQYITLTEHGRDLAESVSQRHHSIRRFLSDVLGIDGATAEANACRIEHAIDEPVLERLIAFAEFVKRCPRVGRDWTERFAQTCGLRSPGDEACRDCLAGLARTPAEGGQ